MRAPRSLADECDRGARIAALQAAERDAGARALAVRLEVKQKNREARRAQEAGTGHHAEPIGPHAVHQHDRAATGPAGDEPTLKRCSGRRRDRD